MAQDREGWGIPVQEQRTVEDAGQILAGVIAETSVRLLAQGRVSRPLGFVLLLHTCGEAPNFSTWLGSHDRATAIEALRDLLARIESGDEQYPLRAQDEADA